MRVGTAVITLFPYNVHFYCILYFSTKNKEIIDYKQEKKRYLVILSRFCSDIDSSDMKMITLLSIKVKWNKLHDIRIVNTRRERERKIVFQNIC